MKKPIIFILEKGQSYQTPAHLEKGEIPLNTGLRTGLHVFLKEGAQDYKLEVITTDMDGKNPSSQILSIDNASEPVKVKKYKNLSFKLIEGDGPAAYTFEAEFV